MTVYLEIAFKITSGVWGWVGESRNETGPDLVIVDPWVTYEHARILSSFEYLTFSIIKVFNEVIPK